MKKSIILAALASVALLAGCASTQPVGGILTDVTLPVATTSNSGNVNKLKVGTSKCQSLLSLVATGDASIQSACKQGDISKIHHIDWKAKNILGIIGDYECTVYGE